MATEYMQRAREINTLDEVKDHLFLVENHPDADEVFLDLRDDKCSLYGYDEDGNSKNVTHTVATKEIRNRYDAQGTSKLDEFV
jgi:hypothetical protein